MFLQHPMLCTALLFFEHAAMLADKPWHLRLKINASPVFRRGNFLLLLYSFGLPERVSEKEYFTKWILGHNFFPFQSHVIFLSSPLKREITLLKEKSVFSSHIRQ